MMLNDLTLSIRAKCVFGKTAKIKYVLLKSDFLTTIFASYWCKNNKIAICCGNQSFHRLIKWRNMYQHTTAKNNIPQAR